LADRLILVGRVAGAFGVKGELKITSYTDDPVALVGYRDLKGSDGAPALTLMAGRAHKNALVGRAKEVATREDAEALRGLELFVPRDLLPPLGRIKSVQNFGAGDLLEIAPESGPSWWTPFTREAAPEVKIAEGLVVVVKPGETE